LQSDDLIMRTLKMGGGLCVHGGKALHRACLNSTHARFAAAEAAHVAYKRTMPCACCPVLAPVGRCMIHLELESARALMLQCSNSEARRPALLQIRAQGGTPSAAACSCKR